MNRISLSYIINQFSETYTIGILGSQMTQLLNKEFDQSFIKFMNKNSALKQRKCLYQIN